MNILQTINDEVTALRWAVAAFNRERYGHIALQSLEKISQTARKLHEIAETEKQLLAEDMQLDGFMLSDIINNQP